MSQPPAFQFYPGDFLSDAKVIGMSTEEVGAYMLLICSCWREDGLPIDPKKLARMTKLSEKRFQVMWTDCLADAFYLDPSSNRFRHPRLDKELRKQQLNSAKRKAAAEVRWMQVHSTSNADAMQTPCLSSSSSSSHFSEEEVMSDSIAMQPESDQQPKRKRVTQVCDEEWLDSLQKNPAYERLPVRMLYAKMLAWCETKRKQPTRTRFLGWLNREEQPLTPVQSRIYTQADLSPAMTQLAKICDFHPDAITPAQFSSLATTAEHLAKARGFDEHALDRFREYWDSSQYRPSLKPELCLEHFGKYLAWQNANAKANGYHS